MSARKAGKPFGLEVHFNDGPTKLNTHFTAKAARHDAKRLAGNARVFQLWLIDLAKGERECVWSAS